MTDKFKEYVTSTAFHLSLSKNQAALLLWIREGLGTAVGYSMFVPTVDSLISRGLVIHQHPINPPFKLTKPGELVADLVEMSGITKFQLPIKKYA